MQATNIILIPYVVRWLVIIAAIVALLAVLIVSYFFSSDIAHLIWKVCGGFFLLIAIYLSWLRLKGKS
jgi:hypothetical protein